MRNRPVGEIPYLLRDARYEKVRVGGAVVSCALLVAVGITPDGQRSVLGVSVSLSEAEVHWREFVASLQSRGLHDPAVLTETDEEWQTEKRYLSMKTELPTVSHTCCYSKKGCTIWTGGSFPLPNATSQC